MWVQPPRLQAVNGHPSGAPASPPELEAPGEGDAPTAPLQEPAAAAAVEDADLRALGEALKARTDEVLRLTLQRTPAASAAMVDALVEESFERSARSRRSRWRAGWRARARRWRARRAGDVWRIFGQLAAQRAASLNEVTKRCLRWRDSADGGGAARSRRSWSCPTRRWRRALRMLQRSLDVTLVRMCESFETERQRTRRGAGAPQEELAFLATHDPLTGLPNRTLILDRVEQMLVRARRTPGAGGGAVHRPGQLQVTSTTRWATAAGDELLQAVAARLDEAIRDTDALGRLGGDEFVVIAEEHVAVGGSGADRGASAGGAEASRSSWMGRERRRRVTVTASIGIAAGDRTSAEELLRDADIAMYRAKWDGKNRYVLFETRHAGRRCRAGWSSRWTCATRWSNDEFFLDYQPTFELKRHEPDGRRGADPLEAPDARGWCSRTTSSRCWRRRA